MTTLAPRGWQKAADVLGSGLFWLSYWLGYGIVLVAIEGARRGLGRADPRLYSDRRRVHAVTRGEREQKSAKFAVLLVWADGPLPAFTWPAIEALGESPFNVVLVSNRVLTPDHRAELLPHCHLLIERKNVGRDFGAYKDAISVIERSCPNLERLALINDSVYFFRDGLAALFAALDGPEEFIGVSEVFEHHYHVASFMLSFGPAVLRHPEFRQFWQRYRPIGTRQWCIHEGEGALSACLIRAGFVPRILYRTEDLRRVLADCSADELRRAVSLLPINMRAEFGAVPSDELADRIASAIAARNQMHAGGLLFRRYLGLPLMKRDMVFRELYQPEEIAAVLGDEPLREAVIADITRRGCATALGPLQRLLHVYDAR